VDNQHKKISGYRDLSEAEIGRMNALKHLEETVSNALTDVEAAARNDDDPHAGRWAAIARTHLETGFMFAIKDVARPTDGLGRKSKD
jgi:hypothetical protein